MSHDKIAVPETDRLLASQVRPLAAVTVPLATAVGRVLREEIIADRPLPPFDRCMMDGYALRAAEAVCGATLKVAARHHAGEPGIALPAEPLTAIEVMTGAFLPTGADVVVPYEDTEPAGKGMIRITDKEPIRPWDYVHRHGSDYPQGEVLLKPGTRLGPVEAGIAASCGYANVQVSESPRIAIIGTGDELVAIDQQPAPHQIRRSNAVAITAALNASDFPVTTTTHFDDEAVRGGKTLHDLINTHDVVVISGAVSRGRKDWVAPILDRYCERIFHGVAQRPGKPMGVWAAASGARVFGLPGNPVSTLVAAHRYVLPYLRACAAESPTPPLHLPLAGPFRFDPPLTLFLPVAIDGAGRAVPQPVNNSGDYARLAGTQGFLELPAAESSWQTGAFFPYTPWSR